ncbi:uncharacterized protein LACBIDRAFT_336346 [Laccaria bicolor S238N-H82]|uniref:Predicted protein n=1 Tax=Laccaria bicolor (strain S238N-H82 / ATCC MYA-4686) TaxID=486041 RepID=B0E568_LACBS|nr:uncharacterized protein LACBIDRAFT_336346 [Laccaria bicolor S238N-H82]EDQ98012.1 predicted protein [Laccaria bicolor S238N-H82]|eukprot:XP_001891336.1 predicted protein [Laccaria bicolor S238N-H82]
MEKDTHKVVGSSAQDLSPRDTIYANAPTVNVQTLKLALKDSNRSTKTFCSYEFTSLVLKVDDSQPNVEHRKPASTLLAKPRPPPLPNFQGPAELTDGAKAAKKTVQSNTRISNKVMANETMSVDHGKAIETALGSVDSFLFSSELGCLSDNKQAHNGQSKKSMCKRHIVRLITEMRVASAPALWAVQLLWRLVSNQLNPGGGGIKMQLMSLAMAEATRLFGKVWRVLVSRRASTAGRVLASTASKAEIDSGN